jgi:hypothetical protein
MTCEAVAPPPRTSHPKGGDAIGRHCTAVCRDGSPCCAWAVRGTDPARCAAHGGASGTVGAPGGKPNALKQGYYAASDLPEACTIDAIIDNLYQRQIQLDAYIDDVVAAGSATIGELTRLLRIHGQNASRLGRLLRDRRAISGEAADGISGAIAQALDELGTEWGVDGT